jgi:hypothetical protein
MTFESWGDWRPYPKYFLGIQTNFAYATVWGMWAPSINRAYKNGEDIRPLKPNGEQNLRLAQLKFQEEEAKKIKASSDTIYKRSVQDFCALDFCHSRCRSFVVIVLQTDAKTYNRISQHPSKFYRMETERSANI